jgi:trimeric autotransporter adhesin
LKQLSKHLTFANAISCIALFVALSGAAYAATTTLGKKSVKTQNLANGAVTTLKLKGGSVTTLKLKNGAVTGPKIGPGAVGSGAIASGAVRSAALGGGVVTEGKLKNGAVTSSKIAGNAVGTEKLANNAVNTGKLASDSVTAGKIANGAVGSASLAPAFLAQLVKNVVYVNKASLANTSEEVKTVSAECPTGKQLVGGGARVLGAATKVAVTESAPILDAEKRTSWSAAARAIDTEASAWAIEAHAICAEF